MTEQLPPAGWFPFGEGTVRWWDGAQWSDHVQFVSDQDARPPGSGRSPRSKIGIAIGVFFALAAVAGLVSSITESTHGSSTAECVRSDGSSEGLVKVSCDDESAEFTVGRQVDDAQECMGDAEEISYMTKQTEFDGEQTYCLDTIQ